MRNEAHKVSNTCTNVFTRAPKPETVRTSQAVPLSAATIPMPKENNTPPEAEQSAGLSASECAHMEEKIDRLVKQRDRSFR